MARDPYDILKLNRQEIAAELRTNRKAALDKIFRQFLALTKAADLRPAEYLLHDLLWAYFELSAPVAASGQDLSAMELQSAATVINDLLRQNVPIRASRELLPDMDGTLVTDTARAILIAYQENPSLIPLTAPQFLKSTAHSPNNEKVRQVVALILQHADEDFVIEHFPGYIQTLCKIFTHKPSEIIPFLLELYPVWNAQPALVETVLGTVMREISASNTPDLDALLARIAGSDHIPLPIQYNFLLNMFREHYFQWLGIEKTLNIFMGSEFAQKMRQDGSPEKHRFVHYIHQYLARALPDHSAFQSWAEDFAVSALHIPASLRKTFSANDTGTDGDNSLFYHGPQISGPVPTDSPVSFIDAYKRYELALAKAVQELGVDYHRFGSLLSLESPQSLSAHFMAVSPDFTTLQIPGDCYLPVGPALSSKRLSGDDLALISKYIMAICAQAYDSDDPLFDKFYIRKSGFSHYLDPKLNWQDIQNSEDIRLPFLDAAIANWQELFLPQLYLQRPVARGLGVNPATLGKWACTPYLKFMFAIEIAHAAMTGAYCPNDTLRLLKSIAQPVPGTAPDQDTIITPRLQTKRFHCPVIHEGVIMGVVYGSTNNIVTDDLERELINLCQDFGTAIGNSLAVERRKRAIFRISNDTITPGSLMSGLINLISPAQKIIAVVDGKPFCMRLTSFDIPLSAGKKITYWTGYEHISDGESARFYERAKNNPDIIRFSGGHGVHSAGGELEIMIEPVMGYPVLAPTYTVTNLREKVEGTFRELGYTMA